MYIYLLIIVINRNNDTLLFINGKQEFLQNNNESWAGCFQ